MLPSVQKGETKIYLLIITKKYRKDESEIFESVLISYVFLKIKSIRKEWGIFKKPKSSRITGKTQGFLLYENGYVRRQRTQQEGSELEVLV